MSEVMQQLAISRDMFEAQLALASSKVKDPQVGLFGPDSMMWRLSRHALFGAHGAGRALLLQIAHPWVTQGVDEHSKTRADPLGRAKRTFTSVLSIVYGNLDQATKYARAVHNIHSRIQGDMHYDAGAFGKGSHYQANEAHAMLWVHATLWDTTVMMYELFRRPLTREEKNRFYEETRLFAYMFGIPDHILPPDWDAFMEYNRSMWNSDQLTVTPATRELTGFLFEPLHFTLTPAMAWLKIATAASLPVRLREDFGFQYGRREKLLFATGRRMLSLAEPMTPGIIRNGPAYVEASRRIRGLPSTLLTRAVTRALFGRPELVALKPPADL
ncbi:MAG: oxygenase MpaB family protein [Pseudomonadota bacterium]|nr:oxygenase MpaB family protein [Pseudomonadota bacterium]